MTTFNFPDNATISEGTVKNFGPYKAVDIDIQRPQDNLIELDGVSYYYTYLGSESGNKGGNSIVLKLFESQHIDTEKVEYGAPDLILKVSKNKRLRYVNKSEQRFLKEIECLWSCNEQKFQNVIAIFHSGVCKIKDYRQNWEEHNFYTMEVAQADLKTYVEERYSEMGIEEKVRLCLSLSEGLEELRSLGYYHRDIKPDNIFMVGDEWKIGDLGLVGERDKVNDIDRVAEFVGPKGWMSPESMNKYLCENKGFPYKHNCIIDHQSDIFQLGKVFWYIFQHNAPIGSVKESDFYIKDSRIYSIIKTMLNHSKKKRFKDIKEIIKLLKICEEKTLRLVA